MVVLRGGIVDSQEQSDTWLWNGDYWEVLSIDKMVAPELQGNALHEAAMAYDANENKMVLYGQEESNSSENETCELYNANGSPGVFTKINFASAQGPSLQGCLANELECAIDALTIRAEAGGHVGYTSLALQAWSPQADADVQKTFSIEPSQAAQLASEADGVWVLSVRQYPDALMASQPMKAAR